MYDDLNTIASLEFGKAVHALAEEKAKRIRAALADASARGLGGSGLAGAKAQEIEIEFGNKACKAMADIWVDLLEGTNGGVLTRAHVDFIKLQVASVAASRRSSINARPGAVERTNQAAIAGNFVREMQRIESDIGRDLEIRFRRQEVGLPKGDAMKEGINLTVHNAANVNLGSQVGTINAALSVISQQGQAESEVATAIRELSQAVMRSAIQDKQKQEALQVIADITRQAEAKPEARSSGTLKALIAGFAVVISGAADVTTLWDKYAPIIQTFFGI